jgi:ABC-2 type transport system ATP-binding protein
MAANGQTVIFSTHVMQHAERLCDHLLLIARGRKIFDGTVDQARASIPRRILLETDNDIAALRDSPLVNSVEQAVATNDKTAQWQLNITEDADPQLILSLCFEQGIQLRKFEFSEPSLHDVFVQLVGDQGLAANSGDAMP